MSGSCSLLEMRKNNIPGILLPAYRDTAFGDEILTLILCKSLLLPHKKKISIAGYILKTLIMQIYVQAILIMNKCTFERYQYFLYAIGNMKEDIS